MRIQPGLENKLNAYEKTSGEDRLADKGRRRRHWKMYAAAAGSGLAMTTSAEANIIYSGPLSTTKTAGDNSHVQWTASIDGGKLIGLAGLSSSHRGGYFQGYAALKGEGGLNVLHNGSGQVRRLASGDKISGGAGQFGSGFAGVRNIDNGNAKSGTWAAKSQPGFVGIKIGSHYGWAALEWGASASGRPDSVTLVGWAYDTVGGQAITAGEGIPSAMPEPSTGLMALLATGCIGVAAWRKRKPKPQVQPQEAATA